jgi:hypothetical protein
MTVARLQADGLREIAVFCSILRRFNWCFKQLNRWGTASAEAIELPEFLKML